MNSAAFKAEVARFDWRRPDLLQLRLPGCSKIPRQAVTAPQPAITALLVEGAKCQPSLKTPRKVI